MPDSRGRRHSVLAICVIKESMHRLLVLPKTAHELEARHIGELSTGGALVSERRPLSGISSAHYSRMLLQELVWRFGRMRQWSRSRCGNENRAVRDNSLGVQHARDINGILERVLRLRERNRALHSDDVHHELFNFQEWYEPEGALPDGRSSKYVVTATFQSCIGLFEPIPLTR